MSTAQHHPSSKSKNDHVLELFKNQNCILEADKNLNERLGAIEEKLDEGKIYEIKELLTIVIILLL